MIQRRHFLNQSAAWLGLALTGLSARAADKEWTTLLDPGRTTRLDDWAQLGEGNWSVLDQTLQGKDGKAGGSSVDADIRYQP